MQGGKKSSLTLSRLKKVLFCYVFEITLGLPLFVVVVVVVEAAVRCETTRLHSRPLRRRVFGAPDNGGVCSLG